MIDRYLHIMSRIIPTFAAAMLVAAMAGCSSGKGDDMPPMPVKPGAPVEVAEYQAGFFITVSDSGSPVGRATPEGDYEAGYGWENHIDLDGRSLHIAVLDGEGRFVCELTDFDIVAYASVPGSKTYHVVATVQSDQVWPAPFKVVVMANWPTYPDLSKGIEALWNASYDYSSPVLSASNLIPFYGVKDCTASLVADKCVDLGTVHLLRAMAKIEVELKQSEGYNWEFSTLQLTRYNRSGLCAPAGVLEEGGYVHGNYDDGYVDAPSIPERVEPGENLDFVKVDERKWVVYVPEYSNTAPGAQVARIKVVFKDSFNSSPDKPEFIDFKLYNEPGQPVFDILRNYCYRYVVSKLSENQNLNLEVQVKPYGQVELRPGFGQ